MLIKILYKLKTYMVGVIFKSQPKFFFFNYFNVLNDLETFFLFFFLGIQVPFFVANLHLFWYTLYDIKEIKRKSIYPSELRGHIP